MSATIIAANPYGEPVAENGGQRARWDGTKWKPDDGSEPGFRYLRMRTASDLKTLATAWRRPDVRKGYPGTSIPLPASWLPNDLTDRRKHAILTALREPPAPLAGQHFVFGEQDTGVCYMSATGRSVGPAAMVRATDQALRNGADDPRIFSLLAGLWGVPETTLMRILNDNRNGAGTSADMDAAATSPNGPATPLDPDQMDGAILAIRQVMADGAFLLNDATGFGKGRILATVASVAVAMGKRVLFLTENDNLFADFWRDLRAVNPVRNPADGMSLLHASARLDTGSGKSRMKGHGDVQPESNLILSTYGQLRPGKRKGGRDRVDDLRNWVRGGVVIMDESHNAAGESSLFEAASGLAEVAGCAIFSSATFARGERNLALYGRVLGMGSNEIRNLKQALSEAGGALRQALITRMAKQGRMIRRDHLPAPPPEPVMLSMDGERGRAVDAFGDFWNHLFSMVDAAPPPGSSSGPWLELGGGLSRLHREFSMLIKADAAVAWASGCVRNGEKAVMAIDLTMESPLRKEVEATKQEGRAPDVMWRDRCAAFLRSWRSDGFSNAEADGHYAHAMEALARIPDWPASVFDYIAHELRRNGIESGEVSGRTLGLVADDDGKWNPTNISKNDRGATVAAFNRGDLDVMLLSVAGAAGISLHAGEDFADQKRRNLAEVGIAQDPIDRIQFWGRVRRRAQVSEPGFVSFVLDTPFDRRVRIREERKYQSLRAFSGAQAETAVTLEAQLMRQAVLEWSSLNPTESRHLGIEFAGSEVDLADRLLMRASVLSRRARETAVNHVLRAQEHIDAMRTAMARDGTFSSVTVRSKARWKAEAGKERESGVTLCEHAITGGDRVAVDALATGHDCLLPEQAMERWRSKWSRVRNLGGVARAAKAISSTLSGKSRGGLWILENPYTGRNEEVILNGLLCDDSSILSMMPSQTLVSVTPANGRDAYLIPLSAWIGGAKEISGVYTPKIAGSPASPQISNMLHGDAVDMAMHGVRMGDGRILMDADGNPVWQFAGEPSFQRLAERPIDCKNPAEAKAFLTQNPDVPLIWAHPVGYATLTLSSADGKVWLRYGADSDPEGKRGLLAPQIQRLLGRPYRTTQNGVETWSSVIDPSLLGKTLFSWKGAGVSWGKPNRTR